MSDDTPDAQARGIRVLHLYDQYLNIYADRGNIAVLRSRCQWRGLTCEVQGLALGETFEPGAFDLLYVGGGQDRDQRMIAERMCEDLGESIVASVESGTALLAVCGGYQLLGHGYLDTGGVQQPGVGLFDHVTEAGSTRMIGNVAIEASLPRPGDGGEEQRMLVVGFENHAGRTRLAEGATALGRVLHGYGNDGESRLEGCVRGRAIGTYLHGPLLPRNPELADWLIAAALAHRYGDAAPVLEPLDDSLAYRAREVALDRARAEKHA